MALYVKLEPNWKYCYWTYKPIRKIANETLVAATSSVSFAIFQTGLYVQ